jgi:uncharacterized protein YndB with AHSA1/START domain
VTAPAAATTAATTTTATFRQTCAVRCTIAAPVERVWKLLTDARRFPTWNSTVTSLDGDIAIGQRLAITVPVAPNRTFRPRVVKLVANDTMVWSDGFAPMFRGVRTFTVAARTDTVTEFAMTETLWGLMLPLVRRSLPDFTPTFDTYARDLRRAAEGAAS